MENPLIQQLRDWLSFSKKQGANFMVMATQESVEAAIIELELLRATPGGATAIHVLEDDGHATSSAFALRIDGYNDVFTAIDAAMKRAALSPINPQKPRTTMNAETPIAPKEGQQTDWIAVADRLPHHFQKIECKYEGVYGPRRCTFWQDSANTHFGLHTERDGRGSQPATHWRPI